MSTKPPLVSIITPTYNREDYIAECIESVIAQDFNDWEMIIIDDGSQDETLKIINRFANQDKRIRPLVQRHGGVSRARNNGISNARGKYLAFLDSDDGYLSGALAALVSVMQQVPSSVKLIYGDFVAVDGAGKVLRKVKTAKPLSRPSLFFQFLISGANPVVPSTCLLNKDILDEIGSFDEGLDACEDVDLWSRLICKYDICKLNRDITAYRTHGDQLTGNEGVRRFNRDRHALRFFQRLTIAQWFPEAVTDEERAIKLTDLAKVMVQREYPTIDTALYLLDQAQKLNHDSERQALIQHLDAQAPQVLQQKYGDVMRIDVPSITLSSTS